jgi:hypothetical protein
MKESAGKALTLPTDAILGALQEIPGEGAAAEEQWTDDSAPAADEPAAEAAADVGQSDASEAHAHEAEAPDAWASSDDPLAAEGAPQDALEGGAGPDDPLAASDSSESRTYESASEEVPVADPAAPQFADAADGAAAEEDAAAEPAQTWDEGPSTELPSDPEGSYGSSPDGAGSYPPHMETFTPLSEADLGTLASIGVEPSDGMGALRLLAALVRLLNRGQHIEPDELRAEIHQSLAQGAMAAASLPPTGMDSDAPEAGGAAETAET